MGCDEKTVCEAREGRGPIGATVYGRLDLDAFTRLDDKDLPGQNPSLLELIL